MYVQHLNEIEPGIYEDPNAFQANVKPVEDHYKKDALKILEDDQKHYEGLKKHLQKKESPILNKRFYLATDIAGGHPKLASILRVEKVHVYDEFAEMYGSIHEQFLKLYPTTFNVEYHTLNIVKEEIPLTGDISIFCHILEHLPLNEIRKLLKKTISPHILIYGPNISKANGPDWFHFSPIDHRTFATRRAMEALLEEVGYKIEDSFDYHQDYFIFGKL